METERKKEFRGEFEEEDGREEEVEKNVEMIRRSRIQEQQINKYKIESTRMNEEEGRKEGRKEWKGK